MTIPNATLSGTPTVGQLELYKNEAAKAYKLSKSAAAEAVANMYMLWKEAGSEDASAGALKWLKTELEDFDAAIAAHNKGLPEGSDDRQVGLGKLEVEISFSQIVKFVFDLKKPSEAPTISRYAKVLEHVHRNKGALSGLNPNAIETFINGCGGFEAALQEARAFDCGNTQAQTTLALAHELPALLAHSKPLATIAYNDNFKPNQLVVLLGRAASNQVDLLGRFDLDETAAEGLLETIEPKALGSAQPMTRFVQQATILADAISEGGKGNETVDGTNAGKFHKRERAYCLIPGAAGPTFAVYCRYVTAAVAVEAEPTHQGIALGNITAPVALPRDQSRELESLLKTPIVAHTQELVATKKQGGANHWKLQSVATQTKGFEWVWGAVGAHPPFRPVPQTPNLTETIALSDLIKLVSDFQACSASHAATPKSKGQNQYQLPCGKHFVDFVVARNVAGKVTATLSKKKVSAQIEVKFLDLLKALVQITKCAVDTVTIHYAQNSMVWIEFADSYGRYTVFIPAIAGKKGLNTNHFKKIEAA